MVKSSLDIQVEKVISGGDGLGHLPDGRIIFIPYTLPGERVKVDVVKEKKDYSVGRVVEYLDSSSSRIQPPCRHYGVCGGCQFQHVSYEEEVRIKEGMVKEILSRQAKISFDSFESYPSVKEWEYRSKSEHPVAGHRPAPLIGYYRAKSHKVVDIEECPVLDSACMQDLKRVRLLLGESDEPCYNELTGKGNLRHVILRRSSLGDRLVGLVTFKDSLEHETVKKMLEGMGDISGVVHNVNPQQGNRITGGATHVISGAGHLIEEVAGLRLRVSFESFFQANHSQALKLLEIVKAYLDPGGDEIVCDAYAGVGLIGLSLAKYVKEIKAIESSEKTCQDGKHNAEINGLSNVEWLQGDAARLIDAVNFNVCIFDPPRKGLAPELISKTLVKKPAKIIYVSCNPSTWARDLAYFNEAGYSLTRAALLDMFPKTSHIEIASLLESS